MPSDELHVVFGAVGALGSAIVRRLLAEGRPVRAVVRELDSHRILRLLPPGADVVEADASDPRQVRSWARDASAVYRCVNVRHPHLRDVLPGITANLAAAAGEAGAVLVFPGNVYGYWPFRSRPAREDHPLLARSKLGRLRNEMEASLATENDANGLRFVIPRYPDAYGPSVDNRLMGPIFRAAAGGGREHRLVRLARRLRLPAKKARWLGPLDLPHDLVYIDDAAAAAVRLAMSEQAHGQVWHVPGAGPLTGREFISLVFRAAGRAPAVGNWNPHILRAPGLVSGDASQMVDVPPQFERPVLLDGSKCASAFPEFAGAGLGGPAGDGGRRWRLIAGRAPAPRRLSTRVSARYCQISDHRRREPLGPEVGGQPAPRRAPRSATAGA